jgi:hypothetical protein
LVIPQEVLEQPKSLHLQMQSQPKQTIAKISATSWGCEPNKNKVSDLLCTSLNGTNWTISREATRPVELSSLSPLSASRICITMGVEKLFTLNNQSSNQSCTKYAGTIKQDTHTHKKKEQEKKKKKKGE